MKKENVINVLNDLPKEFPMDEFLERLIVIDKIDKGLQDIKEGKVYSHAEVKKQFKKWLK